MKSLKISKFGALQLLKTSIFGITSAKNIKELAIKKSKVLIISYYFYQWIYYNKIVVNFWF